MSAAFGFRDELLGKKVSFSHVVSPTEFFTRLLTFESRPTEVNTHFMPQYSRCMFCAAPFDVIGKLDSFEKDMAFMLRHIDRKASCKSG